MQEALPDAPQQTDHVTPRLPSEWNPALPRFIMVDRAPRPRRQGKGPVSARSVRLVRLGIVAGLASLITLLYLLHPGAHAETDRAMRVLVSGDGAAIGDYLRSYGAWAPLVSLVLMVAQAVAAPVPAVLIAFANGLTFGVVWGGVLTIAGQTLAAAVCFKIARSLGRTPVEALAGKLGLATADRWFGHWGARGIVLLRLVPGISFDVISYAAGLTAIQFGPFLVATAIGVAPQAFLYAYLIRDAPQLAWVFFAITWSLIAAVLAVAFVPGRRQRPHQLRSGVESVS